MQSVISFIMVAVVAASLFRSWLPCILFTPKIYTAYCKKGRSQARVPAYAWEFSVMMCPNPTHAEGNYKLIRIPSAEMRMDRGEFG